MGVCHFDILFGLKDVYVECPRNVIQKLENSPFPPKKCKKPKRVLCSVVTLQCILHNIH